MSGQRGFFDLDERYAALSRAGDPLERLAGVVDFELFRPALDAALNRSDGSRGGRPPMDPVLMFKVLVLQARLRPVGCAGGVPDPGPAQLRAVPRDRRRPGPGRDDYLAVPRGSGPGGRGGEALRPVRRASGAGGVSRHGWTDHRREHRARAAPAHDRRGARDRPGRRHSRGLAGKAEETGPDGPGCALEAEAWPAEASAGRHADGGDRHPGLRLQVPYLHRPPPRPDPGMDGDGRRPP